MTCHRPLPRDPAGDPSCDPSCDPARYASRSPIASWEDAPQVERRAGVRAADGSGPLDHLLYRFATRQGEVLARCYLDCPQEICVLPAGQAPLPRSVTDWLRARFAAILILGPRGYAPLP